MKRSPLRALVFALGVLGVAAVLLGLTVVLSPSQGAVEVPSLGDAAPASQAGPRPVALTVPDLGIAAAPLVDLHLDAADVIQVPDVHTPDVIGWYADGVRPGDPGPAAIYAHVSGRPIGAEHSVPGAFAQLHTLKAGAQITVDRADDTAASFVVMRVQTISKAEFPTAEVYGDTPGPTLRLITCGGEWDPVNHRYLDQVIVYAVATTAPATPQE